MSFNIQINSLTYAANNEKGRTVDSAFFEKKLWRQRQRLTCYFHLETKNTGKASTKLFTVTSIIQLHHTQLHLQRLHIITLI